MPANKHDWSESKDHSRLIYSLLQAGVSYSLIAGRHRGSSNSVRNTVRARRAYEEARRLATKYPSLQANEEGLTLSFQKLATALAALGESL